MRIFLPTTLVLILLHSMVSQATIYQYHPNSILYMGGGYNPFKPDQVFSDCIDHDGRISLDGFSENRPAAIATEVGLETVKSRQDFYSLIDFSTQIQGGYTFYSGSASVNLIDERAFHSDSLSWIILFKTDYGKFGLKNVRLRPELMQIEADSLAARCGNEVVVQERRGVMVYAVLTVKNLNEKKRFEFSRKLSVKAHGSLWTAEMEQDYKKVLRSALASTDFSVRVRAIGGRGIVDLTDLLGDEKNTFVKYKQIPRVMEEYIKQQSYQNSAPTQYATAQLDSLRTAEPTDAPTFRSYQFKSIFDTWARLKSTFDRLERIIYGSDAQSYEFTSRQEEQFTRQYNEYTQALNAYYEAGRLCFDKASPCKRPLISVSPVSWPIHSKFGRLCEENRRQAFDRGLVPYEFYQMARRRNMGFIIEGNRVLGQEACEEMFF